MKKSAAETEQAAAEWLARRDGDGWSDRDQHDFQQWISEDVARRIAVIRLESVWRKAGRLRVSALTSAESLVQEGLLAEAPEAAWEEEKEAAAPRRRRGWWFAAIAASIALLSIPFFYQPHEADSYATDVGGFQRLPLADGSRVDINTNSRLDVDYSEAARRIDLAQGEAFFKVAKNPARPFVVHAGLWRVTAVGTAFTVKRRGEDIDVIVTEGRVRIDPPAYEGAPVRPIFASAGQVVSAIGTMPVVRPMDAAALDMALSWRDGLLIFEGRPLGEVAVEFNRYNRTQLVVDPSATDVIVDGSFRATNVEGFLRLLRQGFGVENIRDGQNELILKKI